MMANAPTRTGVSHRPYRIGISGSYGGLNLGDEAILTSIIAQLRAAVPAEITVFTRDSDDTHRRHQVEHAPPVRRLTRDEIAPYIRDLDVFLLGGGGILFDRWVNLFLREALLAEELDVPVVVYGVSVGPLEDGHAIDLVRECLDHAAAVTVRDWASLKRLEEIGVRRPIQVTADPALLLEPEPLPAGTLLEEGLEGRGRLIGMSVREPGPAAPDIDPAHYHALVANAADYMAARFDAHVVFVPMEPAVRDIQHALAVMSEMRLPRRASLLRGEYSPAQLLSLMSHFEFAVGMRLHFLIFAALQHVPFVALPYASKVNCLLEDLQMEAPMFRNVTVGQLLAYVDRSWDQRDLLRSRIDDGLASLKERAGETIKPVLAILRPDAVKRGTDQLIGAHTFDAGP